MNVVYVTDKAVLPESGGIARTTYVMADALHTRFGYSVSFYYGQEDFVSFISKTGKCIVLIQSPCKLAPEIYKRKAELPDITIITVFHGTPGFELVPLQKEIISYHLQHNIEQSWTLKQLFLQIGMSILPQQCFARMLRKKYAQPYGKADKIVVLSPGIIDQYQSIAPGYRDYFTAIPNALSFDKVVIPQKKEKEVLVVARLEDWHKRISEALKIWAVVKQDKCFADWTLRIVGEGVDKPFYKEFVQKYSIPNVHFEGLQNPISYYEQASVFLMTSACEGLPMTLLEAQQCGCVPVVYNSFASARDVVKDGENGFLISNNNREEYIATLKRLMTDDALRQQMSAACVRSSEKYSVEKVAAQWNELLQNIG